MFFGNWHDILRILVISVCGYAALIFFLRVTGKRTLTKLNAFDLVITVALGSTFSTAILSKETPLINGVFALAMLVFLQFAVTWLSVRWRGFGRLVKADPQLVYYNSRFLEETLKRERVTEGEVLQAIREEGVSHLDDVEAVVLETAGTMSVIQRKPGAPTTLRDVRGAERAGVRSQPDGADEIRSH